MKNMNHSFHVAQFGGLNFDTGRKGVAVFLAFLKIRLNMKEADSLTILTISLALFAEDGVSCLHCRLWW